MGNPAEVSNRQTVDDLILNFRFFINDPIFYKTFCLFSKVTSLELAKYNIRVNSISPGAIITEIFGVGQKLSGEKLSLSDDHLKSSEAFNDFQPISRAGLPEDIANLAIYLASDESTFVTGQDFVVDGGLLAGRPLNVASESFKKINRSLKSI